MQRERHRGHLRPADELMASPEPTPLAEPAFDRMSPLIEAAQHGEARATEELLGVLCQPLLHFAIRIASRKATMKRRRASSVRGFLERFQKDETRQGEPVPSPGEMLLADSRRRLLCELLAELPEAQAETMVLRALLGHSLD